LKELKLVFMSIGRIRGDPVG